MKQVILLTLIFHICFVSNSQRDNNTEIVTNMIIRDGNGTQFENKNINLVFNNLNSQKDVKSCTDFSFIPYGNSKMNLLDGFVCVIDNQTWKYSPEYSDNSKSTYYNKCRFGLMQNNSASTTNREILLIKKSNGDQTIMIVAYDNVKTIVINL